ncbi:putative ubiquitinyl hydrolase 1 [Helianthus annuus]|nr:putative ubiquitinyl hydrolase 1 [Helianthus annuus]KAJ0619502.1 putative ubiquitinyl hydrolase 1 [Helianthus annuus]KAJ0786974.1 putative ubiquitinyl hydrolase 1 [Helianthus annuus]
MSNSIAVLLDPLRAHTSSAEPHSSVTHHHAQHFLTFLPILSPQHDSPQRNFIPYASSLCMLSLMPIGYPTLRAFVEFISGFDVPSGRRSKKEDEFLLEIGKPLRPVMFDSVLNNFSPDMPNSFSGRPRCSC